MKNSDLADHWCQLPIELARDGYLPRSEAAGREANLKDLFDPGHTYKYAAPGPLLLNGAPAGNCALWIPTNTPDMAGGGKYFSDPKSAPVRWAVWSAGPRPNSRKSQHTCAPLGSESWYRGGGDGGVLVRFAVRDGSQFKSP